MSFPVIVNAPISKLDSLRKEHRGLAKLQGKKLSVRYRGPRRKNALGRISYSGKLTCLKQDAKTFTIYYV